MSRTLLAAFTLIAAAACGGGDRRDVATADSLSRDLQLAPVDTTAELNDQPAPAADTAPTPAPEPAPPPPAPKPKPSPSRLRSPRRPRRPRRSRLLHPPPVDRSLAVGMSFPVATDAEIRSHKNKVGDEITATVPRT